MPQVIKLGPGLFTQYSREPWVGRVLLCRSCRTKFRVQVCDHVEIHDNQRDGGNAYYTIVCPNRRLGEHTVVFDVARKNPGRRARKA